MRSRSILPRHAVGVPSLRSAGRREVGALGDRWGAVDDRQDDLRALALDRERERRRRRPAVRPVGPREIHAHAVAGLEHPRGDVQLERHVVRPSGFERRRLLPGVAMREVEQTTRDQLRGAVGVDVAQPGGQVRHGCGGSHPRSQDGGAEDLELPLERPVVDERERLVRPLVDRLPPGRQPGAAQPRGPPDVAADLEPVGAVAGLGRLGLGEREPAFADPVERPPALEPPRARIGLEVGSRCHRTPHEHDDRRLAVDAVVLTPQPSVPPARHLAVEVEVGAGARGLDVGVRPGTGQEAFRAVEVRHAAQGDVRVAVGPSGHEHRRRFDRAVVLAQRPVLPERVVPLVLEPAEQPRLVLGDPAFPRVAPTLAATRGSGGSTLIASM